MSRLPGAATQIPHGEEALLQRRLEPWATWPSFETRAKVRAPQDEGLPWSAMTDSSSLPEPFDQRRRVHLVGLVVAGERVHHDVDAGAEGEVALPRFARRQRQHRLAVGAQRPGAGE